MLLLCRCRACTARHRHQTYRFKSPKCWVLPGLDNGACLSSPVRLLRLALCVISIRPSARLRCCQKADACLPVYLNVRHYVSVLCSVAYRRTCMLMCIKNRYPLCPLRIPAIGRRPLPWCLVSCCPSRSSRCLCAVVIWSYLTITGNALLVKASRLAYVSSIYLSNLLGISMALLPPPCCLILCAHD